MSKREDAGAQATPMRVLFLAPQFLPRIGGAEIATLREAVALHALGHEVHILTLRLEHGWPGAELLDGVPVRRVGGLFFRNRLRLRYGAQWLAELGVWAALLRMRATYDVIHLRQLTFLARPAAIAARMMKKPLVVRLANAGPETEGPAAVRAKSQNTLHAGRLDPQSPFLRLSAEQRGTHDMDLLRRSQWLSSLTLRLLRHRGVTMLAISSRIRTHLIRDGFRREQIALIPNSIEAEEYSDNAGQTEPNSVKTLPNDGRLSIVCAARYSYEKGLDYLLHAWDQVHRHVPNARLILAGDGPLRAQLEALAAALELGDSVVFAGPRNDIPALLAGAHGFVLASRYEGLPNALLEAMAAGLPVVATRVSGSEDVIVNGASGLLVPPEDPEALAAALITILTDQQCAQQMGLAARARILEQYQRAALMQRLVQVYRIALYNAHTASPLSFELTDDVAHEMRDAHERSVDSAPQDALARLTGSK